MPEKIVVNFDEPTDGSIAVGHRDDVAPTDQLPPITHEQVIGGAEDVLAGKMTRDASPSYRAEQEALAAQVLTREAVRGAVSRIHEARRQGPSA